MSLAILATTSGGDSWNTNPTLSPSFHLPTLGSRLISQEHIDQSKEVWNNALLGRLLGGVSDQSPTPWLDATRSNPLSYNPIYGRTSRGLERWWFTSDTKTWCKCIDNTFYTQKTIEMSQMTPILLQKRLCFTFGKNPGHKS